MITKNFTYKSKLRPTKISQPQTKFSLVNENFATTTKNSTTAHKGFAVTYKLCRCQQNLATTRPHI